MIKNISDLELVIYFFYAAQQETNFYLISLLVKNF